MAYINDMEYYVDGDYVNFRLSNDKWEQIHLRNFKSFIKKHKEDNTNLDIILFNLQKEGK